MLYSILLVLVSAGSESAEIIWAKNTDASWFTKTREKNIARCQLVALERMKQAEVHLVPDKPGLDHLNKFMSPPFWTSFATILCNTYC